MRYSFPVAILIAVTACACTTAHAQTAQSGDLAANASTASIPEKAKVYPPSKDVSLPELLPTDFSGITTGQCEFVTSGETEISFIVDAAGRPRNIMFLRPTGNDIDKMAIDKMALFLAHSIRFKPGMLNGTTPVAMALSDSIKLKVCVVAVVNQSGQISHQMRLHARPEQKIRPMLDAPAAVWLAPDSKTMAPEKFVLGGSLSAPVPLLAPEAHYTDEARKKGIDDVTCLIRFVVDTEGMPDNLRIVKPVGYGLDEEALKAVMSYRFKPAMRDGMPIPVFLTVAVRFRLRH